VTKLTITIQQAKMFLIHYQHLDRRLNDNPLTSIKNIINKLGCIQYDPLNVVGRNPDLVLQSRIKDYQSIHLYKLLYKERSLLDAWDKMMAIIPTHAWPQFKRIRTFHGIGTKNTLDYRSSLDALELIDDIKSYIKENGPIQSSKLQGESSNNNSWGHRKLSSSTLDYLYSSGEVGIYEKINTQKVYDLIHNLIPTELIEQADPFESDEEFIDWYLMRRLSAIGFLWNKSGGGWLGYYIQKKADRTKSLHRLISKGDIIVFNIQSISEDFYMPKDVFTQLEAMLLQEDLLRKQPKEVRFIAPLDNLIWDRDLTELLFDFKYRWEVYTPVVKRQFGYYVLPMIYGYDFVGRIEPDYYRGEAALTIKNIWYQDGFKQTKAFESAYQKELKNFYKYLSS